MYDQVSICCSQRQKIVKTLSRVIVMSIYYIIAWNIGMYLGEFLRWIEGDY